MAYTGAYPGEGEDAPLYEREHGLSGIKDENIRRDFIRKVFGVIAAQMILTTLMAFAVMRTAEGLMETSPGLLIAMLLGSLVLTIVVLCLFSCYPNETMRTSPTNYILLAVFTAAEGLLVGFISSAYTLGSVIMVVGVTAFVVLCLMFIAVCTKVDFTGFGPYLLVGLLVLTTFGFLLMCASIFELGTEPGQYVGRTPVFETLNLIYSCLGVLLFSFYIIYDTQLIVGGKHHKHQFSIDDYCMAAIMLYLDVLNMFLNLLSILGDRD